MQRKLMIFQKLHMCEGCEGVEMIVIRGALRALGMEGAEPAQRPALSSKGGINGSQPVTD